MAIKRLTKLEIGVVIIVSLQTVFLMVFLAIVFWHYLYLNPAMEFLNIPLPTDKQVYAPGDTIRIFAEICRYTDIPSLSYTELRDFGLSPTYVRNLPLSDRTGGTVGCYNLWTPIAAVPLDFPNTENAVLYGKAVIEINSFITRVTPWQTETFAIRSN